MSIYSSLYSGVSGLTALGNSMSVLGDNIANVNTTGFKGSRTIFQDILNMTVTTGNGTAQVGQGTVLGDVSSTFSQSGFETTDSVTDLAIDGEGFFVLKTPGTTQKLYSRAGAFKVDGSQYLVNPAGLIVQGYKLDPDSGARVGTITDVQLNSTVAAPSKSSFVTVLANLNSKAVKKTEDAVPLYDRWDATDNVEDPAAGTDGKIIAESDYAHSSTVKVYDKQGNAHDITIYFDKDPASEGNNTWEFIVTTNPAEDLLAGTDIQTISGLLGGGTIEFTNDGKISTITAGTGLTAADATNEFLQFSVNFFDQDAANTQTIQLDFGASYNGTAWVSDTLATTQFASDSVNMFQAADGFARGELQTIKINQEGTINGVYSNGNTIPLYQLALAKFNSKRGLDKLGGSIYRETLASGPPAENPPTTNGLGKVISSTLEQSNVDIAMEFVKMITTQRGYQANSKTIQTVDQMIQTVVNLKR